MEGVGCWRYWCPFLPDNANTHFQVSLIQTPFHPLAYPESEDALWLTSTPSQWVHASIPSPLIHPTPLCSHVKRCPPPPPQFISELLSSLSWRMCSIKADRLPVFPERCRGLSLHAQISSYGRSVTGRPSFEDSDSSTDASQLEI